MVDALPPNWTKYTTDDGKDYFHNAITNTTTWDRPAWPVVAGPEDAVYNPSLADLQLGDKGGTSTTASTTSSGGMLGTGGLAFDDNLTFSSTSMANLEVGAAGNDMQPLRDPNTTASSASSSAAPAGSSMLFGFLPKFMFCFDIAYLQTHFDVSSDDVIRRIKAAAIPQKEASLESVMDFKSRPDLWGPFWICTTAVVFLASTGNFAQSFWSEAHVDTDWELVSLSAGMLYGALVGVPLVTQILLYFAGEGIEINLRQLVCVYGYSFVSLLPASVLLMVIPIGFLQWLIALAGLSVSCVFIRNHLWNDIAVDTPRVRYGLIALLFGTHAIIYFIYTTHFFTSHLVKEA
ncbi:unnamed protein product [Amoebophrya sp. A25]|nr:unnamed protein product [Amoebophrya sp. A25]|eukprot:GSA25T00020773001.1